MPFKKIIKYVMISLSLILAITLFYRELTINSVRRIQIDAQTRSFDNLPASFENLSLVFFSDIHYNQFMNQERLQPFIDTINELNPDIILFGGDLFDHPSVKYPDETIVAEIKEALKSLKAPLGKYAVYGNHDLESSLTKSLIASIYKDSDFTLLVNQSQRIYNQDLDFITLVGLDSQLLGKVDVEAAFMDVDFSSLTLTLSHTPDIISELNSRLTRWQLSGHSHGGQVALPIIGPIYKVPYATNYPTSQTVNNIILDVSHGIGTTRFDMRLFANPQIHYFKLKQSWLKVFSLI